eukprot:Em0009g565a
MPSRQEKKRAKRRAKYLEVRDDVLESARASYKADPEKKRTRERERYHADPVKKRSAKRKSYDADPEKKRSAKRESYEADPEKKRSAKRESYKADPEKKRAAKRESYEADPEKKQTADHVGDRVPVLYRWKEMKMEKQRYNSHWTPLYTAAENGHTAVVEMLLKAGADMNKTPLYTAAENGHTAVVEMLLKARADMNKTPLYVAAANGHTAVVEMLLMAGADVNKGSNWCWHIDGYDKLKPFGFPIHACIDGFSRKIIWLELTATNNDPNVVVKFYLDAVVKLEAVSEEGSKHWWPSISLNEEFYVI